MGHIVINVTDNAMIGKLGSVYLSAATIANSIFFLVLVIGIGISMGLTPLVSEAAGGNDNEKCRALFHNGFWVHFSLGLLLTMLCFGSAFLIPFLDQPVEVVALSQGYLKILSVSILPSMIFMHYKQFIEGLSFVRPAMFAMIFIVVLNIIGNYILIYGKLGFPALTLDGAGYATLFARTIGMVILGLYVTGDQRFRSFFPYPKIARVSDSFVRKILSIGVPSSAQYFFEVAAFTASALMAGWIGYREQAAHNLAIHMASITYTVSMGISAAASIRVAGAKGREDPAGIRYAGFSAIFMGMIFMGICAVVFILGKNILPTLYVSEVYVVELTATLLLFTAIFQVSDGVQAISAGALRGISDVKIPAITTFIAYWVIGIPVGYYFGFIANLGVKGIWYGIIAGLTASAIFLAIRFHLMSRNRQLDRN